MPKSQEQIAADMVSNLKATTGKSLQEWLPIVSAAKVTKHSEIVAYLKTKHDIGHGYATMIAHKVLKSDASEFDAAALIAAQYAGPKSALKPIYDKLLVAIRRFGSDVEVAPKKGYVSLRRSKQFALIQPTTAARLDVGINLKGVAPGTRLTASGSFNAMVSHRVRVESAADVDAELIGWLEQAYRTA